MATLNVRFFDDLRGTTPKITTFPTHASTETPDVTVSIVTKGRYSRVQKRIEKLVCM